MKLISVQSRGNRLVRIVCDNNGRNHQVIEKEWVHCKRDGLMYVSDCVYCGVETFAKIRAEKWLEGAEQ